MRRWWVGLVVCAACGDSPPPSTPAPAASASPAQRASARRVVSESWRLERVDRRATQRYVGVDASGGTDIVFAPSGTHFAILRDEGDAGWRAELGGDKGGAEAAFVRGALFSAAYVRDGALYFRRLGRCLNPKCIPGQEETIANVPAHALAITDGADAGPAICWVANDVVSLSMWSDSGWRTTTIGPGQRCAVAIDGSRRPVVAIQRASGLGVWRDGRVLELASNGILPVAATDPRGRVVIAYGASARVVIARGENDSWKSEELPIDLGEIASLALALDPLEGRPRVIATTHDATGFAVRSLAIVDDALASSVIAERLGAFTPAAVAIGPTGPHVVFVDEQNRVVHASRPRPNVADSDLGRRSFENGCASAILDALADEGPNGDLARTEKRERDCEWLDDPQGLTAEWLARACDDARDANACLLAGLELAPRGRVGRLRASSRVAPCEPMKTDCYVSVHTQAKLPVQCGSGNGGDEARAAQRFERACELGYPGGCLLRGELADAANDDARAIEMYRRSCNARLPSACAGVVSMVATKRAHLEDNQLTPVRAALQTACTDGRGPDACNALAFLMERGLGGAKEDAALQHLQACERGSAQSCVRLLVGPGFRGPAPNVPAAALDATLREACSAGADGCYARALALESGWGVPRDDAAARRTMSEACSAGSRSACARASH